MRTAIFPGTFDPPTSGHLDILSRAVRLFDWVYVGVGQNIEKPNAAFTVKERMDLLTKMTKSWPNVKVVSFEGLLVDYVKQMDIEVILRSARNVTDFDQEVMLAQTNRKVSGIDTLYLVPDPKVQFINSTLIRELARYGKRLNGLVPDEIEKEVFDRLHDR